MMTILTALCFILMAFLTLRLFQWVKKKHREKILDERVKEINTERQQTIQRLKSIIRVSIVLNANQVPLLATRCMMNSQTCFAR